MKNLIKKIIHNRKCKKAIKEFEEIHNIKIKDFEVVESPKCQEIVVKGKKRYVVR